MTTDRALVILLVEDDDSIRELTAMVLEDKGYEVHTAQNGDIASEWLGRNKADLLFTDVRMPGKVTGQLLALSHSDMPVLVTSGEAKEQHDWLLDGMEYLSKPYDRKSLLSAIERLATA